MIILASWLAWPGYEAFFVCVGGGPAYLIQVEKYDLACRLGGGQTLENIVMGGEAGR